MYEVTGGVCLWVLTQWIKSFASEDRYHVAPDMRSEGHLNLVDASAPSLTSCNEESSAIIIVCFAVLLVGETGEYLPQLSNIADVLVLSRSFVNFVERPLHL